MPKLLRFAEPRPGRLKPGAPERLLVPLAAAALTATGLATASGATAHTCQSTPVAQSFTDAAGDDGGADGHGYAPDLVGVDVRMDDACTLTIGAALGDHATPGALGAGELVAIFLDTDGDSLTGSGGADRVLVQLPSGPRLLGTWRGGFSFEPAPGAAYGWGGVVAPASALGITDSTRLRVSAYAEYGDEETYPEAAWDLAPDDGVFSVELSLAGGGGVPDVGGGGGGQVGGDEPCRVPRVRGMDASRALTRVSRAGCWYRVRLVTTRKVRPYRVISTSPKAGRRTARRILIRVAVPPSLRQVSPLAPSGDRGPRVPRS